jgi:membrane protease YdiL (CAAX protease family)
MTTVARNTGPRVPASFDGSDLRPLLQFAGIAVPVGWVLLTIPLLVDSPVEPFVLGTLLFGLVIPALMLTARGHSASVRELLRDTVRVPRPLWLLVPAALLIPAVTSGFATALGVNAGVSTGFLMNLAVANVLSSLLIVNLWEEMAWAGFFQRRATARWGYLGGATVTALVFTAVHLPLAFYGIHDAGDLGFNVAVMVISGLGMRLLIGAFDEWGRRSILALAVIHATFNASSELLDPGADWVRYVATLTLGVGAFAVRATARRREHHPSMRGANASSGSIAQPGRERS